MTKKKKKPKMEFRYYQMPAGSQIMALLGDKWVQQYGEGIDYLHFHNYMEIGYCYFGEGSMMLEDERIPFRGGVYDYSEELSAYHRQRAGNDQPVGISLCQRGGFSAEIRRQFDPRGADDPADQFPGVVPA